MSFTKINYRDVEWTKDGMHFLRDALQCENVGVTVINCGLG
nr:hypothetical protein [Halorientalis pallida]